MLGTTFLNAQSPEAFNYQGVARNASGGALVNQQINVRIAIVAANTAEEYVETHLVTTSSTGIFSLKAGTGTVVIGDFTAVDWAEGGNKFIKTSIDENGGSSFKELGSVQLLSVPYALHSKTSDSAKASTPQNLSLAGNELIINAVDLSMFLIHVVCFTFPVFSHYTLSFS